MKREQIVSAPTIHIYQMLILWKSSCQAERSRVHILLIGFGSQDAAHDLELLRKHKVTHILNVAYGVENSFLSEFTYKTISILDVPETNILSYFPECFEFIEQAKLKDGVVLVHCNAGVSRAAAIVIGFLMSSEELAFTSALSLVKEARPSICPNPGFMEQLRTYQGGKESSGGDEAFAVDTAHRL